MTRQRDADLALYSLGLLEGEERDALTRALDDAPETQTELRATQRVLADLAHASQAASPPSSLKGAVLASLGGPNSLQAYVPRLADLFDLSPERVRDHLTRIKDATSAWEESPIRGLSLYHLQGGPRTAKADSGFVRQAAHTRFPHHVHTGDEWALVLEGRALSDTDEIWLPGDLLFAPQGSSHSFVALGETPLLYAVVLDGPLDFRPRPARS